MTATTRAVLQVFARAPVAGRVKTRLIPALGAQGAAQLHCLLAQHVLDAAATAAATLDAELELWCTPDTSHAFFVEAARRLPLALRTQAGADLGERMHGALADALARERCPVLIGSDCAHRTSDNLRAACAALATGADVVLQPAEDGGYALIAASRIDRSLFDAVDWGSARVFAQTLARAEAAGLRAHLLTPTWDVDRPADLERLRALRLPGLEALLAASPGTPRDTPPDAPLDPRHDARPGAQPGDSAVRSR